MAIKSINSVDQLDNPSGKPRFAFQGMGESGGIFTVVIRGGQKHDKDTLHIMFLERFRCEKRGEVFRWKDPCSAWGFGNETTKDEGGWKTAIAGALKGYGGTVFHLSNPMVDMITLLQHCVQNNLGLEIGQVGGFNYGRKPIQEES
jgi:hypothetical protein